MFLGAAADFYDSTRSSRRYVLTANTFGSPETFRCQKCGREYRTKYTCNRHERLECGIPAKYSCSACDFRSKHKHNLKQHYESVHGNKRTIKADHFFNFQG